MVVSMLLVRLLVMISACYLTVTTMVVCMLVKLVEMNRVLPPWQSEH